MNYLPKYQYLEFIKGNIPQDYIQIIDRRGVSEAFNNALKLMCTRFEVSRRLRYSSDGSHLELVAGDIKNARGKSGTVNDEGEFADDDGVKGVRLNMRGASDIGVYNYTPSTRFFSHNTPVGERKYILLCRMLGSLFVQPIQGRTFVDHLRNVKDLIDGEGDPNRQIPADAFEFEGGVIGDTQRAFIQLVSTLTPKNSKAGEILSNDDLIELEKIVPEHALQQIKEDIEVQLKQTDSIKSDVRLSLFKKWDIKGSEGDDWTATDWFSCFLSAVESIILLNTISSKDEETYWARWHFNARPMIQDLFNLLRCFHVRTDMHSIGVYLILVLKTFCQLLSRLLNVGSGLVITQLDTTRIDSVKALIESESKDDVEHHPIMEAFEAYETEKRIVKLVEAEKDAYAFAFDSIFIENGIANFEPKFYETIANYSISLAYAVSAEDRYIDLRKKEFIRALPNLMSLHHFLKGKGSKVLLPEQFEILMNTVVLCGTEQTIEHNSVNAAEAEMKHSLDFYKEVIGRFKEFVDNFFVRAQTAPQVGSSIRLTTNEGRKEAYYFEFFCDCEKVFLPYIGQNVFSPTAKEKDDKDKNLKRDFTYERICDFRIAGDTALRLPEYNGGITEDIYKKPLYQFNLANHEYNGVDLTLAGFKTLCFSFFVSARYEDLSANSIRVRWEGNCFTIFPPVDEEQAIHIGLSGGKRRAKLDKEYSIETIQLEGAFKANNDCESLSWLDYTFAHKDFELTDPDQFISIYKRDLLKLGQRGHTLPLIRLPRTTLWVSRVKGREVMLNLVNAGDLYNTQDTVTRVKIANVSNDQMYKTRKYLTKRFDRILSFSFPVPIDLFIPEAISNDRVKEGGVIYETTHKILKGDSKLPYLRIIKRKFTLSEKRTSGDYYFDQCYTAEVNVDLLAEKGLSDYKMREVFVDKKAGDKICFHLESAIPAFRSVEPLENSYAAIVDVGNGQVVEHWDALFEHPCSREQTLDSAISVIVRNLIFSVSYYLRTLPYFKDQAMKLVTYLQENFGVRGANYQLYNVIPTTSDIALTTFLEECCKKNSVKEFFDYISNYVSTNLRYREVIPTLFYCDVDQMLNDVRFNRRRLLRKKPSLVLDDFVIPNTVLKDDQGLVKSLGRLFANITFDNLFMKGGIV